MAYTEIMTGPSGLAPACLRPPRRLATGLVADCLGGNAHLTPGSLRLISPDSCFAAAQNRPQATIRQLGAAQLSPKRFPPKQAVTGAQLNQPFTVPKSSAPVTSP